MTERRTWSWPSIGRSASSIGIRRAHEMIASKATRVYSDALSMSIATTEVYTRATCGPRLPLLIFRRMQTSRHMIPMVTTRLTANDSAR